jgi:hypothetical protein
VPEELTQLALAVSPDGVVHLDARPPPDSTAPAALARELTENLSRGAGFAILQLAARRPGETLPPSVAFFRDVGALFLARACAAPEVASHDAPADELARLVSQAPPTAGGEYLRPAKLEALWTDMNAALRSEFRDTSLEQWLKDRHAAWNVVGRVCFHLAENKADDERPFAFLGRVPGGNPRDRAGPPQTATARSLRRTFVGYLNLDPTSAGALNAPRRPLQVT